MWSAWPDAEIKKAPNVFQKLPKSRNDSFYMKYPKNLHKYFAVISTKILKFPLSGNFLPKSGHAGNKYRLY